MCAYNLVDKRLSTRDEPEIPWLSQSWRWEYKSETFTWCLEPRYTPDGITRLFFFWQNPQKFKRKAFTIDEREVQHLYKNCQSQYDELYFPCILTLTCESELSVCGRYVFWPATWLLVATPIGSLCLTGRRTIWACDAQIKCDLY